MELYGLLLWKREERSSV